MTPRKILKILTVKNAYYLWIVLLFSLATLFFEPHVAIYELCVFFVLLIYYIFDFIKNQKKFLSYIENLTLNIDTASRDSIFNFAIPVCVLKTSGIISWYNDKFAHLIGAKGDRNFAYDMNISDFFKDFAVESILPENSLKISFDIDHNDRTYHVFGNITNVESDDGKIAILYWDDKTDTMLLNKRYNDEKFVSSVIVCDNYDDVIQDTPSSERPMLVATLDNTLAEFANSVNGVIKKQEKDRYFFYFQKQYLEKFYEDKFSILNKVKEISIGNKIPITLSIGIGCDGQDMAQNDAFSYIALDMALGRGGDQAVIKDGEKFKFFGGNSKEFEKRTRVKARVVCYALKELVDECENVLIMGHKNADIDACGAAMGIYRMAVTLNKEAKIVMQTHNQSVKLYKDTLGQDYSDVFISAAYAGEIITKKSLLIIVDTHKRSLVEVPSLLDVTPRVVVIDHHRRSTDFIDKAVLTYHEPYASSASELVTEIIQYMDDPMILKKKEAEALYAGIYMDTKNFTFKTGVRTFESASFLKRIGVDTIQIKKLFQIDLSDMGKKWTIIENSYIYKDNIAIATCKENDEDMQTIVAQAADELLNIKNVVCSFVLCQTNDDTIFVSARSFGSINVQVILEKLGGGGHMTIAGAQLKDITMYEAVEALKDAIEDEIK